MATASVPSDLRPSAPPEPFVTDPPPSVTHGTSPPPQQLKYLGFFRDAVVEIYLLLLQLYAQLKDRAGAYKPTIARVEGNVTAVVGPALARVKLDPDEYLKFVDTKVDDTLKFAQDHVPQDWKRRATGLYDYLVTVLAKTQAVVEDYQQHGAAATVKAYVDYFVPLLVAYLHTVCQFLLLLPFVPRIAAVAHPYAVFFARQYNHVLDEAQRSNLPLAKTLCTVLPPIPVEKLKRSE